MFDSLTQKFTHVFNNLRGFGKLSEKNIEDALREVRLALLEADVNFLVVKSLLEKIKARALGTEVFTSLSPNQQFFQIVYEELVQLLGGAPKTLSLTGRTPQVILMVGLQGSGKTTSSGKLANHFKKKGRKPFLVSADVYRPAAIDQLKTLAKQLDIPSYDTKPNDKPVDIARACIKKAEEAFCDLVIIDTAGRLHIDELLMNELKDMRAALKENPPLILFVADAMTGQDAVKITKSFHEALGIEGVILTKVDGDARGGVVLSIQHVANCPIYFTGVGEKIDEFEAFNPEQTVSRLLDRGDIMALVEKAKEVINEEEAIETGKKMLKNKFSIEDFRQQLKQMKKLGSMKSLLNMLPGGKAMAEKVNMDDAEKELKKKEAIINSMTMKERLQPEILNGNRRLRIAAGSGTQVSDVNRLVKEFGEMQKMMKQFGRMNKSKLKGLMGR